jgi:phage terminase large subunit|nr:MAG TPA: terminase large subunit [Caudoviricetes sp.]
MINIQIDKKVFNKKYIPYLDNEDRYLLFYGGGSSGKSYYIVQRYVYRLLTRKMNLLVVRQTGNTNRDSTFALFKQVINQWNLSSLFDITDLRIKCKNGNEVIFRGLDDTEKIKSTTFENGELTDIWVEEATECKEADINQLKVRLRGGKSKKQMVLSFNPVNINHWIKRHFIDSKLATVCHSTYKDNKFLTEEDIKVLQSFKDTDPYYYNVYCLGLWGVLGKTFFNAEKISSRLAEIREPIKRGYFVYDFDEQSNKISNIQFKEEKDGFIDIFELPKLNYPYVLSGDTSGEGSDYFTGQVLDNATGRQVAKLRKEFDADEYTRQMYCLGNYYNEALIGIEANFDTFPIKKLLEMGYDKQFVREKEDTYTGKVVKAFGFRTDRITRPLILSMLQAIINDHIELINDKETLEEMLVFVRNEKGRPEAQEGCHDDLVMALAIAYYIRTQQSYEVKIEKKIKLKEYNPLDDLYEEDATVSDYGMKINII